MDVLIIGCGYLGERVADIWREQGRRVLTTTRRQRESSMASEDRLVCDVLDPQSLATLPRVNTVLYAVGFDRTSGASMRSVYVDGLANVMTHLPEPAKF